MSKPVPAYGGSSGPCSPACALLHAPQCLTASTVSLPVHGVSTARATTPKPPLGLTVIAADRVCSSPRMFHARKELAGYRLVADDAPWRTGRRPALVPGGDARDRTASDLASGKSGNSGPLACVVLWSDNVLVLHLRSGGPQNRRAAQIRVRRGVRSCADFGRACGFPCAMCADPAAETSDVPAVACGEQPVPRTQATLQEGET
jgi:hypothetical protein